MGRVLVIIIIIRIIIIIIIGIITIIIMILWSHSQEDSVRLSPYDEVCPCPPPHGCDILLTET